MTRSKNVQPTPQPQSENSDSTLESLRKSEATTRALLNAIPDLVLKLDAEGTYLDFKAPIDFTIKGASPDTRLGRHLHDVLPKQVADQIVKAIGEALRTDEIQLLEYELPRDDGIHTREGRAIACGDGEALLIVRDITERKHIEESLSKRAAELEIVAQISAAASSILDTEALLQKVTDLTQKHFGLYHAQVYFLNDVEHTLDLVAGAGEIGSKMVSQGWHIPLDREQSLVARAARTRQGVIVNDVTQDGGFLPQPLLPDTRSEMAIPLLVAGRALGVLDVQSNEVDHFSNEDVHINMMLAAQIAVALENAILHEQTQTALAQTQTLYEISYDLNTASSLKEILEIMQTTLNQHQIALGIDSITLATIETDAQDQPEQAQIVAWWLSDGRKPPFSIGTRLSLKESALTVLWKTESSKPILIGDVQTDRRLNKGSRDQYLQAGTGATILLPLSVAGRWVGLLNINWKKSRKFTLQDERVYRALIGQVATLVESQHLFDQVRQRAVELEEASGFLDSVIEYIPNMVFVKDAKDLRFVRFNKAGQTLMGVSQEDLLGKNDYDFFPKDEAEFFIAKDREVLAEGKIVDIPEEPIHTQDKGVRYLHTSKVPILDATGEPKYLLGISEDITEQKRTQEALRQSEARFRSLYTNTPAMLHTIDEAGHIIDVSDHWLEVLGYEHSEVIGQNVTAFLAEESKHRAETMVIPEFLKTGSSREVPYQFVRKNGEIIDVLLSAIIERDQDGSFVRSLAVLTDVTEQKAIELALRESEEQFRTLVEHAPEGIFVFDLEANRFVDANQNAVKLLGYSSEELLKISWVDISTPTQADEQLAAAYWAKLVEVSLIGEAPVSEWVFLDKDGEAIPVELRLVHLPAAGRSLLRASVIDIRERKAIEAALLESEEQLRTLVEHAPEGIFVFDLEANRLVDTNQNLVDLLGYPREELLKISWVDISTATQAGGQSTAEYGMKLIQETLAGQPPTSEWIFVDVASEEIPVELRLVHLPAAGRSLLRASVIDIRERKAIEAERDRLLAEVQAAYRQYIRREWEQYLTDQHRGEWRIEHWRAGLDQESSTDRLSQLKAGMQADGQSNAVHPTVPDETDGHGTIVVPIALRGQTIGSLRLDDLDQSRHWTVEEKALVEAVSEQLALTVENLRLFGDTQKRATREQLARQITTKMRAAPDMDSIIKTGLEELANALGVSRTYVKLSAQSQRSASSEYVEEMQV
jgi:PAS domain S-box-containing protein